MTCRLPALLLLGALYCASGVALAQRDATLDIEQVLSEQRVIRDDVESRRGRYANMPADTRRDLLGRQRELTDLLQQRQAAGAALNPAERIYAFNTLEWISAEINNDGDDRMVCKLERTLGSNRRTRVCRSLAQIREDQESARVQMFRSGLPIPGR